MEQPPRGGEPYQDNEPQLPAEEFWDERVIREGLEAAEREARDIDDRTARYIAGQLHGGQASALYALASRGAIVEEEVYAELEATGEELPAVQRWTEALAAYCRARPDKRPVLGWVGAAAAQDRAQLEAEHREALFAEPPDEELGDVQELGWYGLRRLEGRPGGVVLSQDAQGLRQVWQTDSDEALSDRWQSLQTMYARFRGGADDEVPADDTAPPTNPDADQDEDAGVSAATPPAETEPPDDDLPEPVEWTANGYDWIDHLPEGWWAAPVWGREGWALGRWPVEIVAMSESAASDRYAVAVFVEGEVTVQRYDSRKELYRAIDEIAESFWRSTWEYGPQDLPPVTGLLPYHRGPFDQRRPDGSTDGEPSEDERE